MGPFLRGRSSKTRIETMGLSKLLTSRFPSLMISTRALSKFSNENIDALNKEFLSVFGESDQEGTFGFPQAKVQDSKDTQIPANYARHLSLTHVDESGRASMVNVSGKSDTSRIAVASGKVLLGPLTFSLVATNKIMKGDVLTVAQVAGIQAAKQTSNLIPLCHNILLSSVNVNLRLNEADHAVDVNAEVMSVGPTGVEMEAMVAVSVACLTVYDMCKAASKEIQICNIQLESKSGGKSGVWTRTPE